ncbi:chromosome replication initiation inhibitor protein [Janibacter sp. HTCC2649]|uniref:ArgP/LysG family DNA-binding transcriptional regulator n=1 Tax=Janibacter sp. HTCC2649 TaxID=313589 RepID=UPI00006718F3|nr:ArgP/LysG family DNA-binding transcriptional regulator [Janibacter sp. HTCC2649]EAP98215.1 chromosome replication initiation inhibitor protein [Janibacter sp. HTCC2649]
MNLDQVRALAAIVDSGSFESAARTLHLTPSAVSQRVRALESSVGQVVVRRAHPCTATEAGAVLVRLARQVELLEEESHDLLGMTREAPVALRMAINADSLDTWLVRLLEAAAGWTDTRLRFSIADEHHTLALLREGEVAAVVAAESEPVPGCRSFPLGVMRYLPVASPSLAARFTLPGGAIDWEEMPVLGYGDHDDAQGQFLAARGWSTASPASQIPSAMGLRAALLAGMGWLLVPESSVGDDLAEGRVVTLTDEVVDVGLHWHVWKVPSHRLERLNDAVVEAARVGLRPLRAGVHAPPSLPSRPLVGAHEGM